MKLRSTLAVAAAGVVAGTAGFVIGTQYDDAPDRRATGRSTGAPITSISPVAWTSELRPAASCAELLDHYVRLGVQRVGPWGWQGPALEGVGVAEVAPMPATGADGAESAVAPGERTDQATQSATGTNVQEAGVDEPDVVKTDGRTLYKVEDGDLAVYDVSGETVRRLADLELPEIDGAELLLSGDTLVAVGTVLQQPHLDRPTSAGEDGEPFTRPAPIETPAIGRVLVVDVADPRAPEVVHEATYDGALVAARQHGDTVRLVVRSGLPALPFVGPGRDPRHDSAAMKQNRQVVRSSTIEDWLPTVAVDGGPVEPLVGCDEVAVPEDGDTLGTMAVVGFDVDSPQSRSTTAIAVDTELTYASHDQLYLAVSGGWTWPGCCWIGGGVNGWSGGIGGIGGIGDTVERILPSFDGSSTVYAFDLAGTRTRFAASTAVDGVIRDRWSMDAVDGVLRLAVGPAFPSLVTPAGPGEPGDARETANAVLTFRQDGTDLVEIGRVQGLGVDEDIQSVRWFDDLAVVVTFRQIDPLYAIDLSDPSDPTLLGELKIPGFSGYLHPIGEDQLLGIGEGPSGNRWGAQAGLFDVSDLTEPRRTDVVSFGADTWAHAPADPRQFTWLPDERIALTVVSGRGPGTVAVLQVTGDALSSRTVDVTFFDAHSIRLVPLPDGRVVLVSADGVEFLAL